MVKFTWSVFRKAPLITDQVPPPRLQFPSFMSSPLVCCFNLEKFGTLLVMTVVASGIY